MAKKKKKKNKTFMAIVLDRSSSMESTKEQTVEGYNAQVREIKAQAKEDDQEVEVCLVTFASDVKEHLWLEGAENLEEASWSSYTCSGMTAMHDGIGYTVQKLAATANAGKDDAFLVIVISDGGENASRHINAAQLTEQIRELDGSDKWTFTFMGCNGPQVQQVVANTGIKLENCAVWSNTTRGATAASMDNHTRKLKRYMGARKKGVTKVDDFYSEQAGACLDVSSDEEKFVTADSLASYAPDSGSAGVATAAGPRRLRSCGTTRGGAKFAATNLATTCDSLAPDGLDAADVAEAVNDGKADVFGNSKSAEWGKYSG